MNDTTDALRDVPRIDAWSRSSLELLRKIRLYGFKKAVELELDYPSSSNPEWARYIVHLATYGSTRPYKFSDDEIESDAQAQTYRCLDCYDTGFVLREHPDPNKSYVLLSDRCESIACELERQKRRDEAKEANPSRSAAAQRKREQWARQGSAGDTASAERTSPK